MLVTNRLRPHLLALLIVVSVSMVRWLLDPLSGGQAIGSLFVVPIVVAALLGGMPAAVTATIGTIVAYVLLAVRAPDPPWLRVSDALQLLSVTVVGLLTAILVRRLRDSEARWQKTSASLAQSEERFHALSERSPVLLWVNGPEGCEFVNAAYRDFLGVAADVEVRGYDWSRFVHPDDRDGYMAAYLRAFEARVPFSAEFRFLRRDGEWRWMRSEALPRLSNGAFDGYVGATVDITEQKAAERALREADRRKDEFIAMLAHELRNPLAPIRTGLELLRVGEDKVATLDRVRPMMERQVSHMVRLIDDLLEVSRITSGRIELRRQPTLLSEVVANAIDANRAAIDAAGLRLDTRLPESNCVMDVDPTRFVQMLSNLLHNATKFTPAGGSIVVSVDVQPGTPAPVVSLTVRDTGIGIPAATLPKVFDLFVQGEGQPRGAPGLGIGLALTRQLVEMHGGRIHASSEGRGRGSAFTIEIPALEVLEQERAPAPTVPPMTISRRVLIIDDNADAADTLASLVNALGGESETALSGEEGLQRAEAFRPDVILLDIGMPGMDGYETCRRLRANPSVANAFVVALTGWGQQSDKDRATQNGFDAHLTKPADPRLLETLLADVSLPSASP